MCEASEAMGWLARQLATREETVRPQPHNPRPAGVIRPGSGTDVMLRFLRLHPARWFYHPELVLALGRTKGEVDWALQYLAGQGHIAAELTEVPGRRAVMRYRLKDGAART